MTDNNSPQLRKTGSARLSWSRRPGPGHSRTWARISLGGLNPGRRRDKEPQAAVQGSRSPKRRTTLGGVVREEAGSGGVGGGGGHLGRHGIRYSQTQHSDIWVEDLKQEEVGCGSRAFVAVLIMKFMARDVLATKQVYGWLNTLAVFTNRYSRYVQRRDVFGLVKSPHV